MIKHSLLASPVLPLMLPSHRGVAELAWPLWMAETLLRLAGLQSCQVSEHRPQSPVKPRRPHMSLAAPLTPSLPPILPPRRSDLSPQHDKFAFIAFTDPFEESCAPQRIVVHFAGQIRDVLLGQGANRSLACAFLLIQGKATT